MADVEKEWDFSDVEPPIPGNGPVFDYIHARLLTFAVHDWDAVLDKCWQWLAPGGVLEILDAGVKMVVEEGDEADRDALERFHARWHEAALRMGFDREDKGDFREKLREKGFEMLKGEELVLPVGLWVCLLPVSCLPSLIPRDRRCSCGSGFQVCGRVDGSEG